MYNYADFSCIQRGAEAEGNRPVTEIMMQLPEQFLELVFFKEANRIFHRLSLDEGKNPAKLTTFSILKNVIVGSMKRDTERLF
jgi:hypothetical protein